jgi:hypothetical protein
MSGSWLLYSLWHFIPRSVFHRCVGTFLGDRQVRPCTCRNQFLCMASAQFFVSGGNSNLNYRRLYSHQFDRVTGVICEEANVLTGLIAKKVSPEKLSRINFNDPQSGNTLVFLTNNFTPSTLPIAQLQRSQRQVELFFKWIEQQLRIKSFYALFENAVKTQTWAAISMYVLVVIMEKRLLPF